MIQFLIFFVCKSLNLGIMASSMYHGSFNGKFISETSENTNRYLSKSCYFRSRATRIKRGFPRKVLAVDAKETTVIDLFTKQSPGTAIVFKNIFDLPF